MESGREREEAKVEEHSPLWCPREDKAVPTWCGSKTVVADKLEAVDR
jgi:hypothetical protein